MKAKAFFVYVALGVAFAAVSLWVFLSKGKNAKAIRAKYKLGGAMIAAWAILSAANCQGPVPEVSCYDPAPIPNSFDAFYKNYDIDESDIGCILEIRFWQPTFEKYLVQISTMEEQPRILQTATFVIEDKDTKNAVFELRLVETDYKGWVKIEAFGITSDGDNETVSETVVGSSSIVLN